MARARNSHQTFDYEGFYVYTNARYTLIKIMSERLGDGVESRKNLNTDQGSRYTSRDWQECMEENGIIISQDGKGRWADNIVMERL